MEPGLGGQSTFVARLGIIVVWLDEVADVEVRLDEVADVLLLHLWWGGHRRSRLLRLRLCCSGVDLGGGVAV